MPVEKAEGPPGVQMLKQVWRIDTAKKRKEMPPPGVPTSIYAIPDHHGEVPPRPPGGRSS